MQTARIYNFPLSPYARTQLLLLYYYYTVSSTIKMLICMKVTNSLKYFMKNMSQFFHVLKKEKSANLKWLNDLCCVYFGAEFKVMGECCWLKEGCKADSNSDRNEQFRLSWCDLFLRSKYNQKIPNLNPPTRQYSTAIPQAGLDPLMRQVWTPGRMFGNNFMVDLKHSVAFLWIHQKGTLTIKSLCTLTS